MVLIAAPASEANRDSQPERVDSNEPELAKPLFLGISGSLVDDGPLNHGSLHDGTRDAEPATEYLEEKSNESEATAELIEEELPPAKLQIAAGPLIGLTLGMIAAGGITLMALWPADSLTPQAAKETAAPNTATPETSNLSNVLAPNNQVDDQLADEQQMVDQEALSAKSPNQSTRQQSLPANQRIIDDGSNIESQPDQFAKLPNTPKKAVPNPDEEFNDKLGVQEDADVTDSQFEVEAPTAHVAMKPKLASNAPSAAKFDPLDYDPTSIDMVLHTDAQEASMKKPAVEQIALLPINERPTQADQLAPAKPAVEANQAINVSLITDSSAAIGNTGRTATEQLAMPIPKIDLKKIPLATAINLLSELSGAPITLDPISLKHAGIDARRKVSMAGEGISLGEVLASTLKTVRLDYRTEGKHVVTFRSGVEQPKKSAHNLADLAIPSVAELERILSQIGPTRIANQGIEISKQGTCQFEASRSTHYEFILLTERLRLARGLQPQSKYPRRLLSSEPRLAQLATALEHRTTFSFVMPTTLRKIFEHWSQATGLTILVDWQSLAKAELNPQSTLTTSVTQRTWTEAFDGTLNRIGLAWAPIDQQTIWITSLEREANTHYVEFYPGLSESIASIILDQQPQATVTYDRPSRTTIVRGNTAAQRTAYKLWLEQ